MKVEFQVGKRQFIGLVVALVIVSGVGYVYSQVPNPGHSASEINGVQVRVSGTCPSGQYMYGIKADGTVLCRNDIDTDTDTDTNTLGCNWNNWYCDCGADTSGGIEGAVVACIYCDGGTITAFDIRQVYVTSDNANCASGFPCSNC
jgi:hypothetical protein